MQIMIPDKETDKDWEKGWMKDGTAVDFLKELKEFQEKSAKVEIMVGCNTNSIRQ
jgi:hypothetical protein